MIKEFSRYVIICSHNSKLCYQLQFYFYFFVLRVGGPNEASKSKMVFCIAWSTINVKRILSFSMSSLALFILLKTHASGW